MVIPNSRKKPSARQANSGADLTQQDRVCVRTRVPRSSALGCICARNGEVTHVELTLSGFSCTTQSFSTQALATPSHSQASFTVTEDRIVATNDLKP